MSKGYDSLQQLISLGGPYALTTLVICGKCVTLALAQLREAGGPIREHVECGLGPGSPLHVVLG